MATRLGGGTDYAPANMPYATNPIDPVRTSFEEPTGSGPPVLVYPGFTDPLEFAKTFPLAQASRTDPG